MTPRFPTLLIAGLFLTGFLQGASLYAAEPEEIRTAIKKRLRGKVSVQAIERVAKEYGEEAVPFLIETYRKGDDAQSPNYNESHIISCLCLIPSDASIEFLKSLLAANESNPSSTVSHIIRDFPEKREDEIFDTLTRYLKEDRYSSVIEDRLIRILTKKPARTGDLLAVVLPEDPIDETSVSRRLNQLMERLTGYKSTKVNRMWDEWWVQNKSKERYEWLQDSRAASALATLRDRRAIPFFVRMLDDPSPNLQEDAIRGLRELEDYEPPTYSVGKLTEVDRANEIADLKRRYADSQNPIPPLIEAHALIQLFTKAVTDLLGKYYPVVWWRPTKGGLRDASFAAGKGPSFAPGVKIRCYTSAEPRNENEKLNPRDPKADFEMSFTYRPGTYGGQLVKSNNRFMKLGAFDLAVMAPYSAKLDAHIDVTMSFKNLDPKLFEEIGTLLKDFEKYID